MMPRFTVRTKFQAKELFEALGAKEVFTGRAELNKITEEGPIGMGDITHESVVEVTKDGTEGAAATGWAYLVDRKKLSLKTSKLFRNRNSFLQFFC